MWSSTRAALPVVVVQRKRCSPTRITTPSSKTIPSGLHITRVARAADGERVERVRVHAVQELDRVGALDVDLPERARVHASPTRLARRPRTRAARRRPSPRRRAGSSAGGATGRRSRSPRRSRRATGGSASRAPGRRARRGCGRRASANETGVYGGRKVVVPSSPGWTPSSSAATRIAFTFAVLPWSEPVPIVVKRLTCSTERRPGADRAADVGDGRVALEVDERRVLVAVGQRERRRVREARAGDAAGDTRPPRSSPSGTGAPMRSSQRSRPRAWLQRWTRGLQPPVTGGHAVGVAVRRGRAGEHQPGAVVVGEDRRPLERAGREHDPLRADLPEPPAALDREHVVAVVDRDDGRPLEHADRRRAARSANCSARITRPLAAAAAARPERPAADDERLAVRVHRVVARRGRGDEPPLARRAARRRARRRARRASRAASARRRSGRARSAPPRRRCRRRAAVRGRSSGSRRARRSARAPRRASRPRGPRTQSPRT